MQAYHIIFLILMSFSTAFAQVVLVPSQNVTWTDYRNLCLEKNYKCFPDAYTELTTQKNIFYYNLISDFDLENTNYVQTFHKNLQSVLKNEMISLEQLEYLLLATEKILLIKPNQDLQKDYSYLNEILQIIQKSDDLILPEKSLVLFRKQIDLNLLNKKLLTRLSEFKHLKLSYNQNLITQKYFLTGNCLNPNYNLDLNDESTMTLIPDFKESCSLTEQFNQSTEVVGQHFKKHKMTYILSAVALTAASIFLKTHTVSFK